MNGEQWAVGSEQWAVSSGQWAVAQLPVALDKTARFQPRSRGFPAGLLDQLFYGWVAKHNKNLARFSGLLTVATLAKAWLVAR